MAVFSGCEQNACWLQQPSVPLKGTGLAQYVSDDIAILLASPIFRHTQMFRELLKGAAIIQQSWNVDGNDTMVNMHLLYPRFHWSLKERFHQKSGVSVIHATADF